MWRQITGKVYRTNDQPWINSPVIFRRSRGSYTSEIQYPPDTLPFSTNSLGELVNCRLWVNETGDRVSNYECFVGSDRFTFSIPVGDGSAIALSDLRAGSQPVEDYPQSILDYVDDAISGVGANPKREIPIQNSQLLNGKYILSYSGTKPLWQVKDDNENFIFPDNVRQTIDSLVFDFVSYVGFQGTFKIIIWD
jgi:hypothetical protein